MDRNIIDYNKRNCVRKNYDLIAEQYGKDFGTYIEDLDIYEEFEKHLLDNAKILDLGAGTGRTYSYFNAKGYQYIALDFSKEMKISHIKYMENFLISLMIWLMLKNILIMIQ